MNVSREAGSTLIEILTEWYKEAATIMLMHGRAADSQVRVMTDQTTLSESLRPVFARQRAVITVENVEWHEQNA